MSFPSLTPTQHTKLLWIAGIGMIALVVSTVKMFAAGPTGEEESDAARARVDPRRRVKMSEWEKRLWGMWLKGERKRLREARR